MIPKKLVNGMFAVILCAVIFICGFNFNDSESMSNYIKTQYVNTSSLRTDVSMDSVTNQIGNSSSTSNISGTPNSSAAGDLTDLRELAKTLSNYVGKNGHGYTSYPFSRNHSGCTGYDSSISQEITIDFNGNTVTLSNAYSVGSGLRADCSGGVSAMLYFMGLESSDTNLTSSSYTSYGTNVNATKFSDLQVGDILAKSGHVAMVAYMDSDYVYTFDWGSTTNINKCKTQGWAQKYSLSANVSTWRTGTVHTRRHA